MYVSAIVVGAGIGERFNKKASKATALLNSRPLIVHSLGVLNKHPGIKEIIVVGNQKNIRAISGIIRRYRINKAAKVILGGKERQNSVSNGLHAISPKADFILIHDAARPFITKGLVSSLIKEARKSKAVIAGVPVKATVKRASVLGSRFWVKETLNRNNLWEIQTPQVFSRGIILKAHSKFVNSKVTDDAMLVEKLGNRVRIVLGSNLNIKITTPEDLLIAGAILKSKKAE